MRRAHTNIAALFAIAILVSGCAEGQQKRETAIIVPTAATSAPEYRGDGSVPTQRYVVRMSDGQRDWEVEFPEVATGYEMRIPLQGKSREDAVVWDSQGLTDADRELLREMRRKNPGMEREGIFAGGRNVNDPEGTNELGGLDPGEELDEEGRSVRDPGDLSLHGSREDEAAPSRPSYLLGIEEVQRLFGVGKYELAMVRIRQLEKAYPNDPKVLSMKGTLWLKLGQEELAREAWERVLQMDPDNKAVIEALKRLN